MPISIRARIAATILMLLLVLMIGDAIDRSVDRAFAQGPNLVENGGFEAGFEAMGVGKGWNYFHTNDVAVGFSEDGWEPVVAEGEHSQSIELHTATAPDAYAGIYQTIAVEAGQQYELSLKGVIRSDEGDIEESNYGYRLAYAIDLSGNENWRQVDKWIELPWDEQPRSEATFRLDSLKTSFTAEGDSATIFIRAWKKWADIQGANFNIDAVRLSAVAGEETDSTTATSDDEATTTTKAETTTTGETDKTDETAAMAADNETEASDENTPASEAETTADADSAEADVTKPDTADAETTDTNTTKTDTPTAETTDTDTTEADTSNEEAVTALPTTGADTASNSTLVIASGLLLLLLIGTVFYKQTGQRDRGYDYD